MSRPSIARLTLAGGMLVMAATPVLSAAQQAPYSGQPYQGQPYQGQPYQDQAYPGQPAPYADYRNPPPPPEPGRPIGYDGRNLPPPPPGYAPPAQDDAVRAADARYAWESERWERENCVKAHGDVGAGAVIGGIFGAIIGSSLGGWHDRGGAAFAGAAVGAVGGAAIASSAGSGDTSPGCPPGYVVRGGGYTYNYAPAGYYYAAPSWYVPWVLVDGAWAFRPYPYHDWYYRTYRGYGGYGYRGYGGYRGGYGGYRGGYGNYRGGDGGYRGGNGGYRGGHDGHR